MWNNSTYGMYLAHKITMFLFSLFLWNNAMCDTSAQELFEKANEAYKKGKCKHAIKLYQNIQDKSAHVHFNIGNCAYRMNQHGLALLHWRKAEKKWGFFSSTYGRSELIENITLLKEKIRNKLGLQTSNLGPVRVGLIKLKNLVVSLIRSVPLIVIQILFLLLWLFIFIYLRFLYKKKKNTFIVLLFSLIALFGAMLIVRYTFEMRTYGVVVKGQAALLSGPAENFQTLLQLPEAQEVIIKKESGDYFKVKALKRIGWIHKKNVEPV